ncbi:MAG: hypothetical protein JJE47_12945 [Acidimicrobiia bacterium]|nr:hypothetical protein [Acidimicrobiia bacterium]
MNSLRHSARFHRPTFVRLLTVLLGAVLLVSACGQGEQPLASPTTAPATASTTVVASTTSEATSTTVPPTTLPPTTTTLAVATVVLALAPDGLTVIDGDTGSTTQLPFGTPQDSVVSAVDAVLGEVAVVNPGNAECPNGQEAVAVWSGIQLEFAGDQFMAWSLNPGSALTDMTGVGLDSPVSELTASWDVTMFESTLGTEFNTDVDGAGFGGLLTDSSDTATVAAYWAGPICAFR